MNRLPILVAILVASLVVLAQRPPTALSEAGATDFEGLDNGGFEAGMESWYCPPWFAGVVSVDGSKTHGGSRALRFQGRSLGPNVYQDVPASPGQTATLSVWVNVPQRNGSMEMIVELVARQQHGGDLKIFRVATVSSTTDPAGSDGWLRIGGSVAMPDQTRSLRLRIRFPSLDGTAYVDDLSLVMGGSAAPTPTDTPSPTPTPTATSTPVASPSATPIPTATPTLTTPPPTVESASLANSPWPIFGGDLRGTRKSPFRGPAALPALAWARTIDDHWGTELYGSTIDVDGTVYLAAGMAGIYALDPSNGKTRWKFAPWSTGGSETWVQFPPTILSDGGLFFGAENYVLYRLDRSGNLTYWRQFRGRLPVQITPHHDGNITFSTEDGHLYKVRPSDGSVIWRTPIGGGGYGYSSGGVKPSLSPNGTIYATTSGLNAVAPDGTRLWFLDVDEQAYHQAGNNVVTPNGTVVFGIFPPGGTIYAASPDGGLKWKFTAWEGTSIKTQIALGPSGTLYFGSGPYLFAVNPDGTEKWRFKSDAPRSWVTQVGAPVVDADERVYFTTKDERALYAVSKQGQRLWKYVYPNQLQAGTWPNSVTIGADGSLYAPVGRTTFVKLSPR